MSGALESLARLRPKTAGDGLDGLRDAAFATLEEQGLPTRRLEAWKGTSLAPLEAMRFARPGRDPIESAAASTDAAPDLVFVDGRFDPAASRVDGLPEGAGFRALAEIAASEPERLPDRLGRLTDPKRQPIVALQTAFLEDGAALEIAPRARVERPVRIRFVSTPTGNAEEASAAFPRLLLSAGAESEVTIEVEHVCAGSAPGLTAFVAELDLAPNARVEAVEIQAEGAERVHLTSLHARLDRDARFASNVFSLGTGLVRSELAVELAAPGAETRMNGLFLGRESGHVDHFTTVDHAAPHCTSDEEYRGVLADRSKGVFRGRVIVRPDAQKTDARQSNPNLLLSDRATVDAKPQLEIYADDVRASHGSTIGQLDDDALFFLRARGLDADRARLLLTTAFAHHVVDRIDDETLRASTALRVEDVLAELAHAAAAIHLEPTTGSDPT